MRERERAGGGERMTQHRAGSRAGRCHRRGKVQNVLGRTVCECLETP